ncbi:MAG TPA: triple tyrosine motif-containing protein [Leadbetterella sp.]|nr:triple tyrosine motif-containing protein [Leadbetterella sp.]
MKNTFYSYFLLFLTCFGAYSQERFFENISTKDGLASDAIFDLKRDAQGFLWVHSNLGISKYDGYRFEKFGPNSKPDAMDIDAEDNIWFSNNAGLLKINTSNGSTQVVIYSNLKDANPDNDHFDGLFIDKKGWVWSTDFHHLKAYIPSERKLKIFKVLDQNQQTPRIGVFSLDQNGNLWSISPMGFCKYNYSSNKWIRVSSKQDFTSIYFDTKSAQFLLGDAQGQLFNYSPKRHLLVKTLRVDKSIISISVRGSQFLILTPSQLLAYERHSKSIQYFEELETQNLHYHAILVNQNQEIWLGTDEGIFKQSFEKQVIQSIVLPKKLVSDKAIVSSIGKVSANEYVLGLSTGDLLKWNRSLGTFDKIDIQNSGRINEILVNDNQIFLAAEQGLFKVLPSLKVVKLLGGQFTSLTLDSLNRLWLVSPNKPFQVLDIQKNMEAKPWNRLPYPSFFEENLFKKVYYYQNKIWIAGWIPKGFGMAVYDMKTNAFVELSDNNKHSEFVSDYYLNIGLSRHGNLLFSAYGGFNEVSTSGKIIGKFGSEQYQESVADYQYFNIAGGQGGDYWIGTKEGLARMDAKRKVTRYTRFDGLVSNNVSNGFFIDEHRLILGHKNGLSIVDFDLLNEGTVHNELVLTKVSVLGKPTIVSPKASFTFQKADNSLSFSFSPLNFAAPQKTKYRYKLSGVSDNWIENGNNPTFVFPNLNKGKYTLSVQYSKISGPWVSESKIVNFEILPAWYETLWFRILLSATIFALFYAFYKFRLNQIQKVYSLRNRISADLHDEIGASLSSIGILGGLLKQNLTQDPKNNGFAQMISEEAKKAGTAIDYIIWNINPKYDSLESLFTKINKEASELIEAQNIQYEFESNDLSGKNMSLENKRNLYLMLKELINNALKHSQSTKISLKCSLSGNFLSLVFEDNGCGFDQAKESNRNGLKNLKKRTFDLNGHLLIDSEIGKGTQVVIKFSLK